MSTDARARVLVVDDEAVLRRAFTKLLPADRYEVLTAENGTEGIELAEALDVDAVVCDLMMPGGVSGMDVLRHVKTTKPAVEVVLMTAYATVETAVEALKAGAYDYLVKPFDDIDDAVRVVDRAVDRKRLVDRTRRLQEELDVRDRFGELIGSSPSMRAVFDMVAQVAYSDATVLLQGESGTGKELVAKAIHFRSPRRDREFVPVNCGALAETLLESELFGHEKGAFSGAVGARKGLFEAAHEGTIFLDEIGEVSPAMQVKLLRVLNDGEVKRVGSNETRRVRVRVIAATNRDLEEMVAAGEFREDLFFRLNVIGIGLPSLRERAEDIPLLAYHFMRIYAERMGKQIERIDPDVVAVLQAYRWPGNVRELQNVLERAVVLQHGDTVEKSVLPPHLRGGTFHRAEEGGTFGHLPYGEAKKSATTAFEARYVAELMRRSDGNVSQAARLAGMDRANFRRLLKKYPDTLRRATGRE